MNSEQVQEEDAFEAAFYKLPNPKVRAKMSPEKLAILLHECEKNSPAYILIEHELNRRIANVQSRATYVGAITGICGVIVGVLLTAYLQKPPSVCCLYKQIDKNVQTR